MARKRKKGQLVPTTWLEWTETFAALFQLVPEGYTPPRLVRASRGRGHTTYTARFTHPNASPMKAHVRIEKDEEGLFVSESGISMCFRSSGAELRAAQGRPAVEEAAS